MKRVSFSCLFAIVLASSLTAQNPVGQLERSTTPTAGSYSMTTGFELQGQSVRSGPETLFSSRAGWEYYYTAFTPALEWIDECAFRSNRGTSGMEQVNGITFDYCSQFMDPTGDAITVELRFYEDKVLASEIPGWLDLAAGTNQNATCTYIMAGLPGNTSAGLTSCWTINADFAGGFECSLPQQVLPLNSNHRIGVGWMYKDGTALGGTTGSLLDSS